MHPIPQQTACLKRLKLGTHGQITAEEARTLAKQHLGRVSHGEDPLAQKKILKHEPSFKDLARDYVERHGQHKRPKSLLEDQKLLKLIFPFFGEKKVAHVTRRDIEALHLKFEKTPYNANRMLALLSKMFSLAVAWGWRLDNPVKGVPRYPEEKRDRWLDEAEMNRFWDVLDRYPTHQTALFFKLLLLTGARKSELLKATWDQFDLETGIWTKPSHLTKQKRREYLPLSPEAREILQQLQNLNELNSSFLFPSRIEGKPLQEVKTFWKTVLKKANLENVRIHDLRHTHASHLVSSGLSLSIVGKLLGHTQASTTQRYAHLADEPLRAAATLFGSKVKEITSRAI